MEHEAYLGKRLLGDPTDASIITTSMLSDVLGRATDRHTAPELDRERC